MITGSFLKATEYVLALFMLLTFLGAFLAVPVDAQGFSGSDINQYYCPESSGFTCGGVIDSGQAGAQCQGIPPGRFVCICSSSAGSRCVNAIPSPPTLRVIEMWFVRILYVIWAFSGIVFTFILMFLGFKYMTSLGDPGVIQDVVKRIRYWVIGLVLVFLSYPILNTVFNVIGISESECFRDLQMPAFQIFFPNACQP